MKKLFSHLSFLSGNGLSVLPDVDFSVWGDPAGNDPNHPSNLSSTAIGKLYFNAMLARMS